MKAPYYIIRPDMGDAITGCCNCDGPYSTITEARARIREEAEECYLNCDKSLRDQPEDWGEKHFIVQLVSVIRPVPQVEVDVRLQAVEA